jgi:hypothetical protein
MKGVFMESELYKKLCSILNELYEKTNLKRIKFTDEDIILTYMWAVIHDRPVNWACQKKNWPLYYRRKQLPDPSTMSRRIRRDDVQKLLCRIEMSLKNIKQRSVCRWIDAKGLLISNCSSDKQAGYGYAGGGMGKGYKLYAIADKNQGFVQWMVRPMHHNEGTVARELIRKLEPEGYLIGDSAYDKNVLYDIAASKSVKLIAPKKISKAKELGHRRHSIYRMENLERINSKFYQSLIDGRSHIERMFGHLTNFCCGLTPLPGWVRGLFRVTNWVRAKLILYQIWRIYIAPEVI